VNSFEQAVDRLDEIISRLSGGGEGLEESMELYCEGSKLLAFCEKQLDEAKLKTENLFNKREASDDVS
jgi:exodeoxyribonuclease VII small subunit